MEDTNKDFDEDCMITLEYDDDTTEECIAVAIFDACEREYIVLIPKDKIDDEDSDVYLYRYDEDENGEPILSDIESDDEFDAVQKRYFELLDEEDDEE